MNKLLATYRDSYLSYFLMYNFFFLSWALLSSLISVYLLDLGYRPSQVSTVVSVSFFASMVFQPLIGYLNDRFNTKKVTLLLIGLSLLGGYALTLTQSLWGILLAYAWTILLINGLNPVMEKLATSSRYAYGKIRIWGTIGFALGSQLAGLIYDWVSPQAIFVTFMGTTLLAVLGVAGIGEGAEKRKALLEKKVEESPGFKSLLTNRTYLFYTILAVLIASMMNISHTYIPAILEDSGLSVSWAATIVSIAVLCESPLIYFSYLFMDKFKSKPLLLVAVVLTLVQYLVFALDLPLVFKVAATLLTKHIAGMLYIMVNNKIVYSLVPVSLLITALSFVQMGRSLGSVIFQHLAGQILDQTNYGFLYLILSGISLLVLGLLLLLKLPDGTDKPLYKRR